MPFFFLKAYVLLLFLYFTMTFRPPFIYMPRGQLASPNLAFDHLPVTILPLRS